MANFTPEEETVMLIIDNDYYWYESYHEQYMEERQRGEGRDEAVRSIADWFEEQIDSDRESISNSIIKELLMRAFNRVDWVDVISALTEDVEEEFLAEYPEDE